MNYNQSLKKKVLLNSMEQKETEEIIYVSDMSIDEMNDEIAKQEQINERELFVKQIG